MTPEKKGVILTNVLFKIALKGFTKERNAQSFVRMSLDFRG